MICPFNTFKNIFGIPKTGLHSIRFLDTAIIDYILTILISCITTYFSSIPLVLTTIIWFVIGIILHILFGVETNILKYFNISCSKNIFI
jgi:hypothetical protein